jgi:hypothetical protein
MKHMSRTSHLKKLASALAVVSVIQSAYSQALPPLPPPPPLPPLPISNCWIKSGNDCYYRYSGNVGIGTMTPMSKLDVVGSGTCVINGTNSIASNGAAAVCGQATSTTAVTIGVYGNCQSDQGRGVFGASRNTTGPGLGVYGISYGDTGTGLYGWAISPTGVNYGVYGTTSSPQGYAGYFAGQSFFGGNVGFGAGASTPAYQIDADGSALYIIRGTNSISSNGAGAIFGHATSTTAVTVGVEGDCESTQGRGVFGAARNGTGVSIGVYGYTASGNPAGYGVFAGGNLGASGVKTFRIDHPLDPQNSYLLHYSAEAPEPENMYNGVAALDGAGQVWVQLPDYFEEINKDYRYQLTALDAAMPDLHVAARIQHNRFLIAGGKPGMEVSWEVKAVRNDRWVRKYGAPSEIAKPESERGKYQRPELYGMPAEMGIDYRSPEKAQDATNGQDH